MPPRLSCSGSRARPLRAVRSRPPSPTCSSAEDKMLAQAETWVAVAFVILVGVMIYFGVHNLIVNALDQRSGRIRGELDEARRIKEEAQALLAEYRRKQQTAEREAAEIIAGAKAEAERLAVEAKTRLDEFDAGRTRMAETKIAQAEARALADVRAAAADAAVAAAEKILTETVKGSVADNLDSKGIAEIRSKL